MQLINAAARPTNLIFTINLLRIAHSRSVFAASSYSLQALLSNNSPRSFIPAQSNITFSTSCHTNNNLVEKNMSTSACDNTPETLNEWESKVASLSSNAESFKALTLQQRLNLADEIIEHIESIGDDRSYQHDMALYKLGPKLEEDTIPKAIKYTSDVNKFLGLNKFSTISFLAPVLKSIKQNLEHQIAIESGLLKKKGIPTLLSKVKIQTVGGREMNIHGPVEIFPTFHKIEVWADATIPSQAPEPDVESQVTNEHGIAFVLGAGNQSMITVYDALHCFFYHPCKPVLIKHHPLRPHLHSLCSELFAPLIKRGFLDQIVDSGVAQTQAILGREEVAHVHVTGALRTSQAIEKTLAETRPHMSKDEIENMVTSELGCATPWIITPGKYTLRELSMLAKHIVTGKKVNAGCNCLCSQVVILPESWAQKEKFLELLKKQLKRIPTDPAYYPGSCDKAMDIISNYDPVMVTQVSSRAVKRNILGDEKDFMDPYLVDCGTYGDDAFNGYALRHEAFGPLLAIMQLPGDPDDNYLLGKAVPFVNNKDNIYGSLSCSLVYPKTYDLAIVQEATGALNYGCIGLNTWTVYGYLGISVGGTWGGSKFDTTGQSGRGSIGNLFMIPNIEKTVVSSRSLTFPLIVDKNFMPPRMLADAASGVFLAKNACQAVRAIAASLMKPVTSWFK